MRSRIRDQSIRQTSLYYSIPLRLSVTAEATRFPNKKSHISAVNTDVNVKTTNVKIKTSIIYNVIRYKMARMSALVHLIEKFLLID